MDATPTTDSFPRQQARTRRFRLGAPRAFNPSPDGARVVFLRSDGGTDPVTRLYALDLDADPARPRCVVDPHALLAEGEEDLPPEERARRERMREVSAGVTAYAVDDDVRVAAFALSGRPYAVRLDDVDAVPRQLDAPGPVIDPRPDPTGRRVAYVSAGALHVVGLDPGATARVLRAPESDTVTWGLADFAAAEELERVRGFWWLPDGDALLVERCDTAPVATWWIADPAHPDRPAAEHRYPAAGTDNAEVSLWRVPLDGEPTEVTWDRAALPYLATVSASGPGDPVVSLLSRDQRRQVVLAVDPVSAATTVLAERTDAAWVEVVPGVPRRAPSGGLLEVVADPGTDTYRLTLDGMPFTPAGLQVQAVLDVGPDGVLVSAAADPTEVALLLAGWDGSVTPVSDPGAVAAGRRRGPTTVVTQTGLDRTRARTVVHRSGDGAGPDVDVEIESRAETPSVDPVVRLLTTGPRALRTAVLLPTGHVPGSRRLPVLMAPYGGPHARKVLRSGLAFAEPQWWADQGFCVVVADGRGTPGRGPAWDRAVLHDLATPALEDQVDALRGVAEAMPDDVDTTRVAISGWSFGGYLAALAVLDRPDVFHAAVAGAPVTEWRLYDTAYTERYLGDPRADAGPYDRSSLLPRAAALSRPLLLVHGLADDNVVAAHTLLLSAELLAAGRPHTVLPLSGVTHMTPQEVVAENLLLLELRFLREALGIPAEG